MLEEDLFGRLAAHYYKTMRTYRYNNLLEQTIIGAKYPPIAVTPVEIGTH